MRDDIRELLSSPTIPVALAGRVLGIGKNSAYRAAKDGSLPSFKIGGQIRVPTAKLRDMLGISAQEASAA